jgi:type IV pilus assembly protein PilQ
MGKYTLVLFLGCILLSTQLFAQNQQSVERAARNGKGGVSEEELVSFRSDVPYASAVQALSELSKKLTGRIIIDRSPMQNRETGIGINIESMYWKDAFELILRTNQLWYNDNPEYMEIISLAELSKPSSGELSVNNQDKQQGRTKEGAPASTERMPLPAALPAAADSGQALAQTREITISSIFFQINRTKADQMGISWSIFRGSNLNLGVQFNGANLVSTVASSTSSTSSTSTTSSGVPLFGATVSPSNLSVDITTALNIFASDQLGEIIARPQVTVRSGSSAHIQIGQDFSIKEKDFSGNTVEKFYPTGTILTVKPRVIKVGKIEFIDLDYQIERSSVTTGDVSTIIDKVSTSGRLSLLNHEESYVGGLYNNEETVVREGVPILKDLPWWVFGLRYLFGFNSNTTTRRELIVLLKAEFVPTIEERAASFIQDQEIIKHRLEEYQKDIKSKTTVK